MKCDREESEFKNSLIFSVPIRYRPSEDIDSVRHVPNKTIQSMAIYILKEPNIIERVAGALRIPESYISL